MGGGIEVATRVSSMFDRRRLRPAVCLSIRRQQGHLGPLLLVIVGSMLVCSVVLSRSYACGENVACVLEIGGARCSLFCFPLSGARFPPLLPCFLLGPKLACEEDKSIF